MIWKRQRSAAFQTPTNRSFQVHRPTLPIYASFWILFHHLPVACFSRRGPLCLAILLGGSSQWSGWEKNVLGKNYESGVCIDVIKPLKRVKLKVGSMGEEAFYTHLL